MAQRVLGNFPHKISGHPRIFGKCAAVFIGPAMCETCDVVTDDNVGDFATDLGDVA